MAWCGCCLLFSRTHIICYVPACSRQSTCYYCLAIEDHPAARDIFYSTHIKDNTHRKNAVQETVTIRETKQAHRSSMAGVG